MIAVIYRFHLTPGKEAEYQQHWHTVATHFKAHRGALGSCLHKGEDGLWVAYSRWPDRETWRASWPEGEAPMDHLPAEVREAALQMKTCVEEGKRLPDVVLDLVADLGFK